MRNKNIEQKKISFWDLRLATGTRPLSGGRDRNGIGGVPKGGFPDIDRFEAVHVAQFFAKKFGDDGLGPGGRGMQLEAHFRFFAGQHFPENEGWNHVSLAELFPLGSCLFRPRDTKTREALILNAHVTQLAASVSRSRLDFSIILSANQWDGARNF